MNMTETSVERSEHEPGKFVLCIQDYATSSTEPECFTMSEDDLQVLRSKIELALVGSFNIR